MGNSSKSDNTAAFVVILAQVKPTATAALCFVTPGAVIERIKAMLLSFSKLVFVLLPIKCIFTRTIHIKSIWLFIVLKPFDVVTLFF